MSTLSPRIAALAAAVLTLLITSCTSMQAKKPVFKNTRWQAEEQMFVADAGTMTETYTLTFTSDRDCRWHDVWFMPAHPATYVKEDGTVDMIAGRGNETTRTGVWRYRRGKVILTLEDGSVKELLYVDGRLVTSGMAAQLSFEKQ